MGVQADKKVSISSADPVVISNQKSISEPSNILYLAVVISLLGAVGLGFVIGYISPVIDIIKPDKIADKEERSWMGSITPLGALFGGILAPVLIRFLGKKKALISHGVPFTLGWLCFVVNTESNTFFFIGRLLTGLCCGLVCGTAPGYVSEISTVNKRGILGSCFQLFITIGILAASIIGNSTNYKTFAIISAIPSFMMSILMLFMPESPTQIISQGPLNDQTIERAKSELKRLRSANSSIDSELEMIVSSQKAMNEMGSESLGQKFKNNDFYKPLIYSLGLMLVQQMSGVNAILFYANTIFLSASKDINLTLANAVLTGTQTLATFAEMFVVEKLGRRILLICSGCGCFVGLGVMGIFSFMKEKDPTIETSLSWVPLVTLVFYIISFSMGLAPIPWLMVPELTPSNNRAFISGVATAFNWSIAFLVTKFFEPLQGAIHEYGAYFVFMTHTIIGVAVLLVFLPETGGKNMDQICQRYKSGWRNSLFNATSNKSDSIAIEENINLRNTSREQNSNRNV